MKNRMKWKMSHDSEYTVNPRDILSTFWYFRVGKREFPNSRTRINHLYRSGKRIRSAYVVEFDVFESRLELFDRRRVVVKYVIDQFQAEVFGGLGRHEASARLVAGKRAGPALHGYRLRYAVVHATIYVTVAPLVPHLFALGNQKKKENLFNLNRLIRDESSTKHK